MRVSLTTSPRLFLTNLHPLDGFHFQSTPKKKCNNAEKTLFGYGSDAELTRASLLITTARYYSFH